MYTVCQANLFINYSFKAPHPLSEPFHSLTFLLRLDSRQTTLLVIWRPAMPEEIENVHVFCAAGFAFSTQAIFALYVYMVEYVTGFEHRDLGGLYIT
jgi:hypothetical protein